MNARELTQTPEDRFVIDFYGYTAEQARDEFSPLFQWLLERVKPEREHNKRDSYRVSWWIFGEPRSRLRAALNGLNRFILMPETAKHRICVFAPAELSPDHKLYAVCLEDPWILAVLSSRFAVTFILATGGRMGVGNDPIFNNSRSFDPFPFPDATEAQKSRIRHLGEQLDAHRKRVQAAHADVTLTGMYNALVRLREANAGGPALDDKERAFHDRALIGVLATIHDDLDAAVADAYGWPVDLPDDEILARLVSLNAVRAAEEAQGFVRWLRPDFQRARAGLAPVQGTLGGMETKVPEPVAAQATGQGGVSAVLAARKPQPWPSDRYAQIKAVRDLLATLPGTATAAQVASAFTGARPAAVRRHLDMLERIGVLTAWDAPDDRRWHAPQQ